MNRSWLPPSFFNINSLLSLSLASRLFLYHQFFPPFPATLIMSRLEKEQKKSRFGERCGGHRLGCGVTVLDAGVTVLDAGSQLTKNPGAVPIATQIENKSTVRRG